MTDRKPGEPPADAVADRSAQDHEQAGGEPPPGFYPADRIEDREGDVTPDAADPHVEWDTRIQPERSGEEPGEDIERGA